MKFMGAEFGRILSSALSKVIPDFVLFYVHTIYFTIAAMNITIISIIMMCKKLSKPGRGLQKGIRYDRRYTLIGWEMLQ